MTTTKDITVEDGAGDLPTIQLTARDFKGQVDPDWCPGCGDFGVLNSLQRACAELGLKPHEILVVSGIGCSSNLPGYFNANGMHTLHGRSLAVATGAKLANHDLNVIVTGGASNIGRAISLTFGGEGANVSLVDIDEESGNKVVRMIREKGPGARFIKTDVTKYPG